MLELRIFQDLKEKKKTKLWKKILLQCWGTGSLDCPAYFKCMGTKRDLGAARKLVKALRQQWSILAELGGLMRNFVILQLGCGSAAFPGNQRTSLHLSLWFPSGFLVQMHHLHRCGHNASHVLPTVLDNEERQPLLLTGT